MRDPDELLGVAEHAVRRAVAAGADEAEAFVSEGRRHTLLVIGRRATPAETESSGISVRVRVGRRSAVAGSAGLSSVDAVVAEAMRSAGRTPEQRQPPVFATPAASPRGPTPVHPAVWDPDPERLEAFAEVLLERLMTTPSSTFASVSMGSGGGRFAVANSLGVRAWDQGARENAKIEVRQTRGTRERSARDIVTSARPIHEGTDPVAFADACRDRARDALDAEPLDARVDAVLLRPVPAAQFLEAFTEGLSGPLVNSRQSPLTGRVGQVIAPETFDVHDRPYGGTADRMRVDHQGSPTAPIRVVERGRLTTVLHDPTSAKVAGVAPTGHGMRPKGWGGDVGVRPIHLDVAPGPSGFDDLLASVERAILVTDPIQGSFTANKTTGDFSHVLPYAFLVEHGKVRHALPPVTVAGNTLRLLADLRGISDERREAPSGTYPSMHAGGVVCST